MKVFIQNGDVLTCLTNGTNEHWYLGEIRPTPPYTINGIQVNCTASVWDVQGNDYLEPSTPVIIDAANKVFAPGPRPKNIIRRK